MSSDNLAAVSSFIEGAPPGELADVIADIKSLTVEEPSILQSVNPAFKKYNEEQLATTKLPGSSQHVIISPYNSLGEGRYYDVESQTSFSFDHTTQKASNAQSHVFESQHTDLMKSVLKSLATHAREHYPTSTYAVFPSASDSALAILLVANRYSPSNFWNGRWRSTYLYNPTTASLTGTIKVDVHYYEDGNVRLTTTRPVASTPASSAGDVVRQIAMAEKNYHEELNRGFTQLSEGAFKGLRRQLPVTRQKVAWEKIGNYRLGQDIGGARTR
ncbi:MAG: f-actin-capping subunit alpha [Lasallia pustulata]|uniref:F-actin-capping protein subunit alpha n=1 Tax=Lasallia pustulata TaxID=136370 RepID=A0A5M8PVH5_9LECA|nr:MAG: f-actin-capping subunit alpha [Lasallia pustulata]